MVATTTTTQRCLRAGLPLYSHSSKGISRQYGFNKCLRFASSQATQATVQDSESRTTNQPTNTSSPTPSPPSQPSQQQQPPPSNNSTTTKRPQQKSRFPIPSLFKKQAGVTSAASIADYPWLLDSSPSRRPRPTLWSALRDKHFLAVGTARARKHMNHPTYNFPNQFCQDAAAVTKEMFAALSDPERAVDEERLRPVMVRAVADRFAEGARKLKKQNKRVEFRLKGEPQLSVSGLHFTYGPYPAPAGYIAQQWWSLIELVMPKEDNTFTSHPRQKEVMQRAMDDGVYFRVDVRATVDLEFVVFDTRSEMPLLKDRRERVELQFVSPHFTPWDEIFELDEAGEWFLKWQWRVSDVDWLVESMMPKAENSRKIDVRVNQPFFKSTIDRMR
ncbi:hypothetical protein DFS34DRAFT_335315 [Phlyctochytrium arcticum]|nr:hypothetical protein DFS34DRAFT_335315 [Phlyctochytrium arcticum]